MFNLQTSKETVPDLTTAKIDFFNTAFFILSSFIISKFCIFSFFIKFINISLFLFVA